MKISRREKHLIWIAGAVVAGIGYYNFIYSNQAAKLVERREELTKVQDQYDTNMTLIDSLATRSDRMEEIFDTLQNRRKGYYSDIIQEKIILELEDLLKASGLSADISFTTLTVDNIEILSAGSQVTVKDTLSEFADKYNGKATTNSSNAESTTSNTDTSSESSSGLTKEVVKQQKVKLSFNGTYDSLKAFINLAELNSRKIVISKLNMSSTSDTDVTGTMEVEFYSLSSLNEDGELDVIWTLNNIYGKDKFISSGAATGAYNDENEVVSDFSLVLRATNSELPTISLGQTTDAEKISYITSNSTDIVDVTVEFNEENGNLYYKYSVGNETFPKDNSQLGMTFTTNLENINMEILSTNRVGTSDNSGINLKIINNTVKKVSVVVSSDDETKPRVNSTSEGNVTVTKK